MTPRPGAADGTQQAQAPSYLSNLFNLPPELRLQIYAYLFVLPARASVTIKAIYSQHTTLNGYTVFPPLMRISSVIREDAMGLYLQHLQDLQTVLAALQRDWEDIYMSARKRRAFWIDVVAHHRSRDDRKWRVRVDEVEAQIRRVS
ncbi:hypothetical protein LTS10_009776 [Elasticomyces elasticus]|nr:hypothetical protein LTS10_009776 [Elasticomyces elasticus]